MSMTLARLIRRNLLYYWRTNLAVIAGVAIAVAVLGGALLVGASVRASLRDLALRRLGATDYTIAARHFFRDQLAADITNAVPDTTTCPIVHVRGFVTHEASGLRAHDVEIYGVDERFWRFHGAQLERGPGEREAIAGVPLARELQLAAGESLLIRLDDQEEAPRESLFGRRQTGGRTLRLSCSAVLPKEQLGDFSPRPARRQVLSLFVPLQSLRRTLGQPSGANLILVHSLPPGIDLVKALSSKWNLADAGLTLGVAPDEDAVNLESAAVMLDESVTAAALDTAEDAGIAASAVYSYLANAIRCGTREIPYSVVTAADLGKGAMPGSDPPANAPGSLEPLWLNEWARDELKPAPGSEISLSYFVWRPHGRLETESAQFRYAGTVKTGPHAGPSLAPSFPGITAAASIGDWDPPFPLDLRRIRPEDERYWDLYRTTPKAFIRLEHGRQLWGTRFGNATSVRLAPRPGIGAVQTGSLYREKLVSKLALELPGFEIRAAREEAMSAARGSTDFGEYFVYFSFFLIAAALLLSALFFRLGVEQRVREVGLLRAQGYTDAQVRKIFLLEAALIAACGVVLGVPLSAGYGAVLMHGLRTWWIGASGTTELHVHIAWAPLTLGAAAGFTAAFAATALSLRRLGRGSPRSLLSGTVESREDTRPRIRLLRCTTLAAAALAAAALTAAGLGALSDVTAFFSAGMLLLLSSLSAISLYFRRGTSNRPARPGWRGLIALGTRNAGHRPGRAVACVALIACAIFVIASLETFRRPPGQESQDRHSGTGGFPLLAEAGLPVLADLNSSEGLKDLGFQDADVRELAGVRFFPFRVKPGDDASCLNLYAPQEPGVLGVPAELSGSDRFSFRTAAESGPHPWRLLELPTADGAIPAIADANTIQFILHKSVGDELQLRGAGGTPVRLRLVAALRDSIFQRELLVSEKNFTLCFPDQEGFRFFLVDAPPGKQGPVTQMMEERLSDLGFDVRSTADELAGFHAVENTYLSTFQSLGGLGLVLGTVGLAAVLLRNVLERRKELALMQAVGFTGTALAVVVVAENAALLVSGLLCGTSSALLAVSPALAERANPLPVARLAILTLTVFAAGLGASLLAVVAAFRSPLVPTLRSE